MRRSGLGDVSSRLRSCDALSANELGFFSQLLVQVTLPHRDPGDVIAWGRRNGAFTLSIQPCVYMDGKASITTSASRSARTRD